MNTETLNEPARPLSINPQSVLGNRAEICAAISARRFGSMLWKLALIIFMCAGVYGLVMGASHSWMQAVSSFLKVPLLFCLTLVISLPALHFVGLFLGSRVHFLQTLAILLLGLAATSVLLFAFAAIALFFQLTGSSYQFSMSLHVVLFGVAGAAGMKWIRDSYASVGNVIDGREIRFALLYVWMALYMFVGTQTAYFLSPFVGRDPEFHVLHRAPGNFYTYLSATMWQSSRELRPAAVRRVAAAPANKVLRALKKRDFTALSRLIHPTEGVSLYADDRRQTKPIVLSRQRIRFAHRENPRFLLGIDAVGKPRTLSFREYYVRHLYDMDFTKARPSYGEFMRLGKSDSRFMKRFSDALFVEFSLSSGTRSARRWSALRLAIREYQGRYFLTAIQHGSGQTSDVLGGGKHSVSARRSVR